MLKDADYQTASIGKWHLNEPSRTTAGNPFSGARNWDAFTPPGVRRHGFDYWYSYGTLRRPPEAHYWRDTPKMICADEWSVQHETSKAIEYLRDVRTRRPFALYISWNPPHSPYDQVPQKYSDLYPDVTLKDNACLERYSSCNREPAPYTRPEQMKLATRQYYAMVSGLDRTATSGSYIYQKMPAGLYDDTVSCSRRDHGDMRWVPMGH